jgi:beta-mannosidase
MRFILYTVFLLLPMLADAQYNASSARYAVEADWEFRQADSATWRPVQIPVSIHTALRQNGLIDDPFYRDNEEKLQWIETKDWEFRCAFDVNPAVFERKHIELAFKGIDTYAHIYLNDSLILETDNMFRHWRADVKKWLKPTGNVLTVYFESPVKKVEEEWKNLGYELPGGIRTMTRKAQFHYGWDWGPRFVGCGILQKPELIAWDELLIEDVFVRLSGLTETDAYVTAHFRYRSDIEETVGVTFDSGRARSLEERTLSPGVHEDSVSVRIPNPKLWWCAGMGEPYLYDFQFFIRFRGQIVERKSIRTGLRTVRLVQEKDAYGENFYFELNGVQVFAKGANYIPQDIFQDRVSPERYKRVVDDALAANMNMLRVWGGGIYEDDLFYQLCDAKGILVWQDFMYACALYPGNGRFLKTAALEALEQIERLRNHPSIALWCGNNENNEAWHYWGWQMQFTEGQRAQLWRDYQTLFNDLLPTYVKNYAGGVSYWESSPKYGRANPKSTTEGDSHYWGVWHDEAPFESFDKKVPRFMSEYGFQSFPEWRTIQSFTLPEDRKLDSKVMLMHQKHPRGNALIAEYMKRDFRIPKNFEDFVYVSQVLQAEGMRTGIEAHRRNKPYCMGTLYWQLNDVWPVASWSSIDSEGRWKALHYYVREAYKQVVALPIVEEDSLSIYGVSDLQADTNLVLGIRTIVFDGKEAFKQPDKPVLIDPYASRIVEKIELKKLFSGTKPESAVVEIILKNANGLPISRRLFYAAPARKMKLPKTVVVMEAKPAIGGYELTLQSDKLAKNVLISTNTDGFFADNYFDLLPGETKKVFFKTGEIIDDLKNGFRVKHLQEAID